ncbi:MAG: PDR/VanB family oxidoreductase [Burkholderiaceae bacterium]
MNTVYKTPDPGSASLAAAGSPGPAVPACGHPRGHGHTRLQAADFVTLKLMVRGVRIETDDIRVYELCDPHGRALPQTAAGAHVDVHLAGGRVRSYSLAGDPRDRSGWWLAVQREMRGRGGSRTMHDTVRPGDILTVGQPRQDFGLIDGAHRSLLLADGIGIAPLKAMAHELTHRGAPFELHYAARTSRQAAFVDALRELLQADALHLYFDAGEPVRRLDIAALLREPAPGTHAYFCGSSGFMADCEQALRHWPPGMTHAQHFTAPAPVADPIASGGFEVYLARSRVRVPVAPGQSIVRALELTGRRVPTSCLAGICGACKTRVLDGEVEHRDFILSEHERQCAMTVCVSRARGGRLVLDL